MVDDIKEHLTRELASVRVAVADMDSIVKGGQRRSLRNGLLTACVVLVGGLALVVSIKALWAPSNRGRLPVQQPDSGSTEFHDPSNRFSIVYPDSWDRAADQLSPHVEEPREIFSVASFPLRPRETTCPYSGALEDIGANGAFVSLSESSGNLTSRYLLARPGEQFTLGSGYEAEVGDCADINVEDRMIPFQDGSRFLFAYVALGHTASTETKNTVLSVLNSLEFEE